MIPVAAILGYGLAAIFVFALYTIVYQYTYWKRRKMLHLESVPIIGNNYPMLFGIDSFPMHAQKMYKKFSGARYYGCFDFRKPVVIIKDPDLIKEICVKNFDDFTDHLTFVTEEMDPIAGRNIFSLKGKRWKDLRSTLTPSYTAARMKLLFELIDECARNFGQYILENPEFAKSFEAKEVFTRYTNDVIATAAFGVKVDSMKDQENEFFMHGKASTTFTSKLLMLKIVLLRNFPRLMRLFGATFLPRSSDKFFKKLINEAVTLRREKDVTRPDTIQLLMQAMDKEGGVNVTMDDILGNAFIFFLAGFDTSSSLMAFMALELAANPDIQEKLQQEVDLQLEKNDGKLTYEALSDMKYLDMVVSETLRKYPPAPITNRVCTRDHVFSPPMQDYPEYRMEKDTVIMIPIYALHRDPQYFPEPEKFDPERFNEENKSKIEAYTYMPFGHGPRQCIGNRFALMETKILMVHVLRKFTIKFIEKTVFPVEFIKLSFNLGAVGKFWLQFEERKKVN
ncbi:cytochrome P450 9e2-like [Nasonia vitripennis]|uniref:Cytochrome P450 n=1 Tax=Nasonia vitripennis TaxID=7425 RepID=A0A7M7QJB2_NASVI|nr:cytochrome P450 9P5 [Nasonia vitripennis]XP_031788634.1 cytochrome P450 9P5 isoform X1 [Nasonia vitripennis]XP_031788635.1 cytochrome P450 9P5 isoform X1 [Nasonia vitripennis]XP_031788637.1 cytochrome P450 9e2-like [Nasonia vitripennis]XP_032456865.1 cytochrome P450 9e2-like [Nasonia vitripennis]